jgi:hypothetical protein
MFRFPFAVEVNLSPRNLTAAKVDLTLESDALPYSGPATHQPHQRSYLEGDDKYSLNARYIQG